MKPKLLLAAPLLGSIGLHAGMMLAAGWALSHQSMQVMVMPAHEAIAGVSMVGGSAAPHGERRPVAGTEDNDAAHSAETGVKSAVTEIAPLVLPPAENAPVTSPPMTPGSGASQIGGTASQTELAFYAEQIRAKISASLRYPLSVRRRGVHGRVGLKLTVNGQGQLQSGEVAEPSGSSELDALALEAASSAQPYPPPEGALKGQDHLVLNLPVEFRVR